MVFSEGFFLRFEAHKNPYESEGFEFFTIIHQYFINKDIKFGYGAFFFDSFVDKANRRFFEIKAPETSILSTLSNIHFENKKENLFALQHLEATTVSEKEEILDVVFNKYAVHNSLKRVVPKYQPSGEFPHFDETLAFSTPKKPEPIAKPRKTTSLMQNIQFLPMELLHYNNKVFVSGIFNTSQEKGLEIIKKSF